MAMSPIPLALENAAPDHAKSQRQNSPAQGESPFSQVLSDEIRQKANHGKARDEESHSAQTASPASAQKPAKAETAAQTEVADQDASAPANETAASDASQTVITPEFLALASSIGSATQPATQATDATEQLDPADITKSAETDLPTVNQADVTSGSQTDTAAQPGKPQLPNIMAVAHSPAQSDKLTNSQTEPAIPGVAGKKPEMGAVPDPAEPAQHAARPVAVTLPSQSRAISGDGKQLPAADAAAPRAQAMELRAADNADLSSPLLNNPIAASAHQNAPATAQAQAIPQLRLAPAIGTPAWNNALGQNIRWMVTGGHQTASLMLNPADLGPVQVVLSISNDQASANFYSAQPDVRQAIEAAMPRLRDMMQEAGIQLGQATVSADLPQQNDSSDRQARQSGRMAGRGDSTEMLPSGEIAVPVRTGRGLVDTYA